MVISNRAKKTWKKVGLYALVLVVVLPILFPLYFVFISSLKNMSQVYLMPPQLFGFTPTFEHYRYIFETQNYGYYMFNSAVVAIVSTAIALVLGVPAAYSIARFHMRKTSTSILAARLLPSISFLLPYYFVSSKLKMIDTYTVLILSHVVLSLPFVVWIMASFIADIPKELDEAAIVDGCTRQRCFLDVILPVSLPGLVTCTTLSFLGSWEKTKTLPVSLQYFVSGADIRWGRMLAATIVVIIPAIILTMTLQKYIIKGMTAGAVKG